MNVRWQGFHIKWNKDTGAIEDRTEPKPTLEDFKQIRYAWPDLRKTVVSTQYSGSSNTGTEIYSYFTERPAMEVYGEFGIAIFKPIFNAVTGVVPAETLLGKIAEKLFETAVTKSLKGDPKLRDFAQAVAGQVLGKALESVADREPFASINATLEKHAGEDLVAAAGGELKGKAVEAAGDKLSALQRSQLEQYLSNQCRYDLVQLKSYGVVLGGISVVDRQTGNATVFRILNHRQETNRRFVFHDHRNAAFLESRNRAVEIFDCEEISVAGLERHHTAARPQPECRAIGKFILRAGIVWINRRWFKAQCIAIKRDRPRRILDHVCTQV